MSRARGRRVALKAHQSDQCARVLQCQRMQAEIAFGSDVPLDEPRFDLIGRASRPQTRCP